MPQIPQAADSTPSPWPGEGDLHRFLRCSHILSSALRELLEERFLTQASPPALTQTQFCFLKMITLNPELQVGEVARRLNVSAAATSKAVDRLERLGLVSRAPSPDDRRAILVSANAAGCELVSEYERLKASYIEPVIDELGPDRLDELCKLLERVCVGLLRDEKTPAATCLRCAGYHAADCLLAQRRCECGFRSRRGARA